jgi:hypothetical protein
MRVSLPVAAVTGAIAIITAIPEGLGALISSSRAHKEASFALARSKIIRAFTNSISTRQGEGFLESADTLPYSIDTEIMRRWRRDPTSVTVRELGGPLSRISKEDWNVPYERVDDNFGSLDKAEEALWVMVGDIPENARTKSELSVEINNYFDMVRASIPDTKGI